MGPDLELLFLIFPFNAFAFTKESIIDQTYSYEISPIPSLPKRGIPPFDKGRGGGI
jgi:hypothetical protein